MKKQQTEKEKFNKWMRKKVKSVYYFDNERMCNAYEKIVEKK